MESNKFGGRFNRNGTVMSLLLGACCLVMLVKSVGGSREEFIGADRLQCGFTKRCQELCDKAEINKDLQPDCQRGCQYFNLHFLISASDKKIVTDIQKTIEQCFSSCKEAYVGNKKYSACNWGCQEMHKIQMQAPYINGWLVYMGTTDENVVLLQPDYDIPTNHDWVMLESVLMHGNTDSLFDDYQHIDLSDRPDTDRPQLSDSDTNYQICNLYTWLSATIFLMIIFFTYICWSSSLIPYLKDEVHEGNTTSNRKHCYVTAQLNSYFYPMIAVRSVDDNTIRESLLEAKVLA